LAFLEKFTFAFSALALALVLHVSGLGLLALTLALALTPLALLTSLLLHYYIIHQLHHNRFTALFPEPPGWAGARRELLDLWCKERLTEADTQTIWLGATPSGLTIAHLHHPPHFFTGQMPFVPPNQQCQSTEGN